MVNYRLEIKPTAVKELEAVGSQADRQRIVHRIALLGDEPRPAGCRKLSGAEKYRVRSGDYRIVYGIDDGEQVVTIVKIGHRRDVYR